MSRVLLLTLALAPGASAQPAGQLTLEVRVFHGTEEVTADTRITLHRAGERGEPVAQIVAKNRRLEVAVPAGIYDLQVVRERDGRVVNIRWAERLVVMPYPDEEGRHLEVINFTNGYGALQVRQRGIAGPPDAGIYAPADHERPAGARAEGTDYVVFVVLAGKYDVQTRTGARAAWHRDIDVPLDRTRLWFVP
jgi:hypothetical protein